MFIRTCKRLFALLGNRASLLAGILFLLFSLTLTAHAILTVSNSGVSGDAGVTVDGSGTLNLGTASSTSIVLGRSGVPITLQGSSLNVSGTSTFTGNVGIGTSTPASPLTVAGDAEITGQATIGPGLNSFSPTAAPYLQGAWYPAQVNISSIPSGPTQGFSLGVESEGAPAIGAITYRADGFGAYTIEGDSYVGASADSYAFKGQANADGASTVAPILASFYAVAGAVSNGATATLNASLYSEAQNAGANNYFTWFDSQGVGRCKDDSSFNSVDQSICVVYNPLFTKYTPGATNYERIVYGEWNSNVAYIGTENGGTGSARALSLMTGSAARMTIGATGNVGIGTTSPAAALDVNATSTILEQSFTPGPLRLQLV